MIHRLLRVAALVAIGAAASVHLQAAPRNFLWKATGPGGVVYLVGSVHVLGPDAYPLDPAFERVFESAGTLVEELDMAEMLEPASQMSMLTRGMLPPGQTLDAILAPATLAQVKATLSDMGIPIAPLMQFKPWMLAVTLQSMQWQKAGLDPDLGLDKHFFDLARARQMPVRGLETLDFQLSRFDGMSPDLQDRLLTETLKELETTKASFTEMANAWKTGDVNAMERLVLTDLRSEPEMYQRLLVERNKTWLPKIEALFSDAKPAFIVVGAAHLVGSDGLLQMLKARGYTVEQL
jgi:uncharacterized protein YbaP (TraB family)